MLAYNSVILLSWKIQKNLKTIKDLQLHHNFFIKGVLIRKLVHMKAYWKSLNVFIWDKNRYNSFRWQSKWASFLATSRWDGHDIVHKNYSHHVVSILFVGIYPISCSDEFVNHSWKDNLKYIFFFKKWIFYLKNKFDW